MGASDVPSRCHEDEISSRRNSIRQKAEQNQRHARSRKEDPFKSRRRCSCSECSVFVVLLNAFVSVPNVGRVWSSLFADCG